MRRLSLALGTTLCLAIAGGCATTGARPAPRIQLNKLLQAPERASTDWAALEGNVVVLEFWATWCGPCIAAIPHLNELADYFADKPVRFVAITDEGEDTIRKFIKKKPIKAWIGLDEGRATHKAYGVRGIPHTFVIDRKGVLVADMHSASLTKGILNDVLAGRRPSSPRRTKPARPGADSGDDSDAEPLCQVVIRPAELEYRQISRSTGRITAEGITLRSALSIAYDVRETRIVEKSTLPPETFTIVASVPRKRSDALEPLLQSALTSTFDLTVSWSVREVEVLVLTAPAGLAHGLQETVSENGASMGWGGGVLRAVNKGLDALMAHIEKAADRPVVDETGLSGRYDFELRYEENSFETMESALREQLGLELVTATRPVKLLVVDVAE